MRTIEVPQFIKGLIFDCDGTLVDSMPLHMKAWEHVIVSHGGQWDFEFFFSKKGMPEEKIVSLYNEHFARQFDPGEMVQDKHTFFRAHASEFKPIQHVLDVVLKYRGILPMAIASGGVRENVELELDALCIKDCFQAIMTADDDVRPKPFPGHIPGGRKANRRCTATLPGIRGRRPGTRSRPDRWYASDGCPLRISL